MDIDVRFQYHSPDQAWAAIFLRDGAEWFLNGALVGMGSTLDEALTDLMGIAQHLVVHGENFLTEGQIPPGDREWLFHLLDRGLLHQGLASESDVMYAAMRQAGFRL
jgi:hypothetical protein